MKKLLILMLYMFLISCTKDEPIIFNYNFLIGTWVEYKPMEVKYIDSNKPYEWGEHKYDTIAFTPSYQQIEFYKYNGTWFTYKDVLKVYSCGDVFKEEYSDFNEIRQDGKNIIIETHETDYNRKFFHFYKKISNEWELEYMLNDIKNK